MEGDLQRALGEQLRSLRMAQALSQEAFADVLGVHRTYMGAVERGERNLTLRSVERIADRLGISARELLVGAGSGDRGPTARPERGRRLGQGG